MDLHKRAVLSIEQAAERELQQAESLAGGGDFEVADWELAQHRLRLGRACWELGQKQKAAALWRQAAATSGPAQVGHLLDHPSLQDTSISFRAALMLHSC